MANTPYDYDVAWEERWDDMKKYGPYSRHVRRLAHRLLADLQFTSVLDVGCGQGEMLLEMLARYPQVKHVGGIDYSQSSAEITAQRVGQGNYFALDLQTDDMLERFEQPFDLTYSLDVVEHIEDDVAALANIHGVTGKYVLIGTVQGNHLPEWEKEVVGHVRNYRRGELIAKMESVGF